MVWQDIVFMIGGFIFAPALIFMVKAGQGRETSLKASLTTAIVLTVFVLTYISMGFYLAAFSTTLTAVMWYILANQRRKG